MGVRLFRAYVSSSLARARATSLGFAADAELADAELADAELADAELADAELTDIASF
jgi:hypothetical protein